MKAVVMDRYGTPDVLEMRDVPTPTPTANEVLVRVHTASINDWDYGLLLGTSLIGRMMSGLFTPKVRILGCDIAGRVEAMGEGVEAFQPGDEVYGDLRALNPGGTYVTVGGSVPRLLQTFVLDPIVSQVYGKHVRLVSLKANKDLAHMNELFASGKLLPVIEGPYRLADLREAFRLFGTGDHKGKIIVSMA